MQSSKAVQGQVGKNIRWLRRVHNMGQRDLMDVLSIRSQPQMSQIENGQYRVSEDVLQKIAQHFNIPFYYLYADNLQDLMRISQDAPAESSSKKHFYSDVAEEQRLEKIEEKVDKLLSVRHISPVETIPGADGYLSLLTREEKHFICVHLPLLPIGSQSVHNRFNEILNALPEGRRTLVKLHLSNAPSMQLDVNEIRFLSNMTGQDEDALVADVNFVREQSLELAPRDMFDSLTYGLESVLITLKFHEQYEDNIKRRDKVSHFSHAKSQFMERLRKAVTTAIINPARISRFVGLSEKLTQVELDSVNHHMCESIEPYLI